MQPWLESRRPVQNLDPAVDKELNAKRKRLGAILARPAFPKGYSFKFPTLNEPNRQGPNENALQVSAYIEKAIVGDAIV